MSTFIFRITASSFYACAKEAIKPSVPEFNIALSNHSTDTPATYTIDPYTGENMTHPSTHTEWTTLDLVIKNQEFNSNTEFYAYNVRVKGYYGEAWTELYSVSNGYATQNSTLNQTVLSYQVGENGGYLLAGNHEVPVYGKVDFQVQAMIGTVDRANEPPNYPWTFYGEVSDWSSTQTFTFSNPTNSLNPTPTASSDVTPQNTEEPYFKEGALLSLNQTQFVQIILVSAIIVLVIEVPFLLRKEEKNNSS
ncbi:MAG: hypothetical protein ACFCUE_09805 [Candidatus Bathyarchaeia archaeon]